MATAAEDDAAQHARVALALDQINNLRYRFREPNARDEGKDASDDESVGDDDDTGTPYDSEGSEDMDENAGVQRLSLEEHIERMLVRTRTMALLRIANNTAEILPDEADVPSGSDEDEEYNDCVDERVGDDEEQEKEEQQQQDELRDQVSEISDSSMTNPGSFRRSSSMRKASMSRKSSMARKTSMARKASVVMGEPVEGDPEQVAAMRLARKLSAFLSLPKVISYSDLVDITEKVLEEPNNGQHAEYEGLIDAHVESPRDVGGQEELDPDNPLWKRRRTKALTSLEIADDPHDVDLQQRRMFMEANGFNQMSGRSFFGSSMMLRGTSRKSSGLLLNSPGSMRSAGSKSSMRDVLHSKDSKASVIGNGNGEPASSISEESEEKAGDNEQQPSGDDEGKFGTALDESEYHEWRTEVKNDYLAWVRAKVLLKQKQKDRQKKAAGEKPRWLLLYEAGKEAQRGARKSSKAGSETS